MLPNVFDSQTNTDLLQRLEKLSFDTQPKWGTMNASKMLAHCNVTYGLAFDRIPVKNSFFMKLILKWFIKKVVTGEKPYPENSRTAPVFMITEDKDFAAEKATLIANIKEVESKGRAFFEGKENVSFGVLTSQEWSNMFYKHLDHHFRQFGV